MSTSVGGFPEKRGFFRAPDSKTGGGGTIDNGGKDDDENKKKKDQEPQTSLFAQLKENLQKIDELFKIYEFDKASKLLEESLKLTQDYQSFIPQEQQTTLRMYINAIKQKAEQYDPDFFETEKERGSKKKAEKSLEKKERHEVLLERMEKSFAGIDKYLQATKELGVDLSNDEVKDLISDLELVFSEFIDQDIKKSIKTEISGKIATKSEKIRQGGVSDNEKIFLQKEIEELTASLINPFTYISKSGFNDEQLRLIKEKYEKFCNKIKQFQGTKRPSEEQQINRGKGILESAEFIDFLINLRKLSNESEKLSKKELNHKYTDLMAHWSELGLRPRIFYDVFDLSYQDSSGQTISGESVYKQYKQIEQMMHDIEIRLVEVGGEIKTFNFREIADEIMERQLDLFRFGDRRNPANQLDERRDALDNAFKYWSFGSVFNNEYVVFDAISSVDIFSESLDKVDSETKQNLFKKIFDFFILIHNTNYHEAAEQKDNLISEVANILNLSESNAKKWIVEAYKKVGRVEVERLEIKAELQTFFMDNVMQTNQAAAGDRSQLQDKLETYQVGRNELLVASTYHPEYGWLVRKLLEDLQAIAVLTPSEVVVKRLVKKQNLYAFSPELGKREFDYVEVLQRVIAQPQDLEAAKAKKKAPAEYLKEKLEEMGETVVYLPDYQNRLIDYNSFSHSERGRANLQTAIDILISQMGNNPELKNKLDGLGEEGLEKAKMFTSRLFTIFDSLSVVLTERQKNTTTRAHNGAIEDVDRISLADPEASMVHRSFRYPGNYSEPTSEILAVMSPINAEQNLYVGAQPSKSFESEQSFMYSELNNQGQPVDDRGQLIELKPVHSDYIYQLGKKGDVRNGKYMRADAMQLATIQRMQWEFYEQLFPIINKMPLIRRRGFLEPLGFSTNQIIFLNQSEWERERKAESVWDFTNGSVGLSGKVINKIDNIDDILNPKKEYVTELQFYNTAEKNGLLGILERMYASTSSGGRLSTEQLFSSNKSILHDWFKAWGRIKMYPSPVVRDAFVPMTYLMIRRAMSTLECVSGNTANIDEIQDAWQELINTLESNLRDGGGLDCYGAEIATVINLLCSKPVYKILDYQPEKKEYERIRRFNFEKLNRGDYKAEDYRNLDETVGPKPGDFQPIVGRRSARINYAISRFLYESVLKTKPYVKVPRPQIKYNPFTGKRREAIFTDTINWNLIGEKLKGFIGDFSRSKAQLERTLQGKSGGISNGSVISRKGDSLVQVKEDKK